MKKTLFLTILILISATCCAWADESGLDLEALSETAKNVADYNSKVGLQEAFVKTLGSGMTDILKYFFDICNKGVDYLGTVSWYLALVLGILDLSLPILLSGMSVSIAYVIPKIMKIGFVIFTIDHWKDIVDYVLSFFEVVTGRATQDLELASATFTQPQIILQKALQLLTPGINYCTEHPIMELNVGVIPFTIHFDVLALLLQTWMVLFTFALIAVKMVTIYLQFYLSAMFCIFTVPFAQIKFLKYMFENFSTGMFNSTLLMFTTLFLLHLMFICTKDISTANIFSNQNQINIVIEYTKICAIMMGMAKLIDKVPRETQAALGGQIEFN